MFGINLRQLLSFQARLERGLSLNLNPQEAGEQPRGQGGSLSSSSSSLIYTGDPLLPEMVDDLLFRIFSFIKGPIESTRILSLVCRRFRDVVHCEAFWERNFQERFTAKLSPAIHYRYLSPQPAPLLLSPSPKSNTNTGGGGGEDFFPSPTGGGGPPPFELPLLPSSPRDPTSPFALSPAPSPSNINRAAGGDRRASTSSLHLPMQQKDSPRTPRSTPTKSASPLPVEGRGGNQGSRLGSTDSANCGPNRQTMRLSLRLCESKEDSTAFLSSPSDRRDSGGAELWTPTHLSCRSPLEDSTREEVSGRRERRDDRPVSPNALMAALRAGESQRGVGGDRERESQASRMQMGSSPTADRETEFHSVSPRSPCHGSLVSAVSEDHSPSPSALSGRVSRGGRSSWSVQRTRCADAEEDSVPKGRSCLDRDRETADGDRTGSRKGSAGKAPDWMSWRGKYAIKHVIERKFCSGRFDGRIRTGPMTSDAAVLDVKFALEGCVLLAATRDGGLYLLCPRTGQMLRQFVPFNGDLMPASPSGAAAAAAPSAGGGQGGGMPQALSCEHTFADLVLSGSHLNWAFGGAFDDSGFGVADEECEETGEDRLLNGRRTERGGGQEDEEEEDDTEGGPRPPSVMCLPNQYSSSSSSRQLPYFKRSIEMAADRLETLRGGTTSLPALVAGGYSDGVVRLFSVSRKDDDAAGDAVSGAAVEELNGHGRSVVSLRFLTSDRHRVGASSSSSSSEEVHSSSSSSPESSKKKKRSSPEEAGGGELISGGGLTILPCPLLSGCLDGRILSWDLSTSQIVQRFSGSSQAVNDISPFSAVGGETSGSTHCFLAASKDKVVRLYDTRAGDAPVAATGTHKDWVLTVEGRSSASFPHLFRSADKSVHTWDSRKFEKVQYGQLHRHRQLVTGLRSDALRCVSCSLDGSVKVSSLEKAVPVPLVNGPPHSLLDQISRMQQRRESQEQQTSGGTDRAASSSFPSLPRESPASPQGLVEGEEEGGVQSLCALQEWVMSVDFAERHLAIGTADGKIEIFDFFRED